MCAGKRRRHWNVCWITRNHLPFIGMAGYRLAPVHVSSAMAVGSAEVIIALMMTGFGLFLNVTQFEVPTSVVWIARDSGDRGYAENREMDRPAYVRIARQGTSICPDCILVHW